METTMHLMEYISELCERSRFKNACLSVGTKEAININIPLCLGIALFSLISYTPHVYACHWFKVVHSCLLTFNYTQCYV